MRRTLQVIALLIAILCGSVPGLWLVGAARPEPCRCCAGPMGTGAGAVPCRMPGRAPGPSGPCSPGAPGTVAPTAALAAPCLAIPSAQLRPAEPSPVPRFLLADLRVRRQDAGPSVLARPGPVPPFDSSPTRLAKLSLLLI